MRLPLATPRRFEPVFAHYLRTPELAHRTLNVRALGCSHHLVLWRQQPVIVNQQILAPIHGEVRAVRRSGDTGFGNVMQPT